MPTNPSELQALAEKYKTVKGNWPAMLQCHEEMVQLWAKYHTWPTMGRSIYDGRPRKDKSK